MDYKIEKNIPITKGKKSKYPFKEMEVGDSFECGEYSPKLMRRISATMRMFSKQTKGFEKYKFTVKRINDNKIRVWRIR